MYNKMIGLIVIMILGSCLVSALDFSIYKTGKEFAVLNWSYVNESLMSNSVCLGQENLSIYLNETFWNRSVGGDLYPYNLNDQVGIGTKNPTEPLDVVSNLDEPELIRISNTNSSGNNAEAGFFAGSDSASGFFGAVGSNFTGIGVVGFLIPHFASKTAFLDFGGTGIDVASNGNGLRFFAGGLGLGNLTMTLNATRNVGIGTNKPTEKLTVVGEIDGGENYGNDFNYGSKLDLSANNARDNAQITFTNTTSIYTMQGASVFGTNDLLVQLNANDGSETDNGYGVFESVKSKAFVFSTFGSGGVGEDADIIFSPDRVERMRINGTTGNVGIGTDNPQHDLVVNGTSMRFYVDESNADYIQFSETPGIIAGFSPATMISGRSFDGLATPLIMETGLFLLTNPLDALVPRPTLFFCGDVLCTQQASIAYNNDTDQMNYDIISADGVNIFNRPIGIGVPPNGNSLSVAGDTTLFGDVRVINRFVTDFRINSSNGYVGINTNEPNSTLHVIGNTTIKGNLNVTQNADVDGWINSGNFNLFPLAPGDVGGQRIFAQGSMTSASSKYGFSIVGADNGLPQNFTSFGNTVSVNNETQILCDSSNPFFPYHEDMWLATLSTTPDACGPTNESCAGATGEIEDVINSSCILLNMASAGNDRIKYITNASYIVFPHPRLAVTDNGFLSVAIGPHPDARAEFECEEGYGEQCFFIEDEAKVDNHQALSVHQDIHNNTGTDLIHGSIFSTVYTDSVKAIGFDLDGDGTNINNSELVAIKFTLLAPGGGTSTSKFAELDSNVDTIWDMGEVLTISSAYYNDTINLYNVTENVTDENLNFVAFENDLSVVYWGNGKNFTETTFTLDIVSSQDINTIYWYCNGSNQYEVLLPTSDTTSGMKNSGTITFISPSNRGTCNTDIYGVPFPDQNNYTYIAAQRNRLALTTPPTINGIQIVGDQTFAQMKPSWFRLQPRDTPPVTCTGAFLGGQYFDISEDSTCECNSNGWQVIKDGSACT